MSVFRCSGGISNGELHCETMKRILSILLWIWQAPQNVVGLVFRLIYGWTAILFRGVDVVVSSRFPGGISLGRTIIVKRPYLDNPDTWNHEYGHTRQSLYLGPFYLFVVGIPSLLWALYWTPDRSVSYYAFYTEKWADRLGGVIRKEK